MNHHTNIVRIKAVAHALAGLNAKVVFVGGATISLYPDRPILDVRPTDDVDVIIEIVNYKNRSLLEERLRTLGFSHDIDSGVICRYRIHGIIVDIAPTDDASVGFSNRWYPAGFEQSISYQIDEQTSINILDAPYFIATKLEAHKGRGDNDGRTSQDFEDIVFVLENRSTIWQEMSTTNDELQQYLLAEFLNLSEQRGLREWIDCHVERGAPPATSFIMEEIKKFITKR